MTPPTAVTPAARTKRAASPRPASPHPSVPRAARRPAVRRPAAPAAPRRFSGPARPSSATAAPVAPAQPLLARLATRLRALPDASLLDRVVRGRLWIPLLGVLLAGIVAMQVEVLKLNAGIGHSMIQASTLQSRNQQLRTDVSQLSDDQRIMTDAAQMGMSVPPPSTPKFVRENARIDVSRALANIQAPDATGFAARTAAAAAARAAAVTASTGQ